MSTLIFIGGATASGKSSLVKKLKDYYPNSKTYRRVQGFYDLATIKNIPIENAFEVITSQEVDENFISICNQSELVFSDVHYAVQMNRKNKINIYENYVPTISFSLIKKLKESGVDVIPIFLDCSPQVCFDREKLRFDNGMKDMRNISVKDAEIELLSEKKEFYNVLKICNDGLVINSETNTIEELIEEINKLIYIKKPFEKLIRKKEKNERNNL